ncbi:MAG: VOC family protein [Actinomycetota bacterium]|nr:VOC family protein [Actinomycetota bacterium]
MTDPGVDRRLSRAGGISYLHIPATDVRRSAAFYGAALGWTIHNADTDRPGFDDGGGCVSGAFVTDQQPSTEPGFLLYVYVDRIDEAVDRIRRAGGEIVRAPYDEGNLRVATFRDPAGNVVGL